MNDNAPKRYINASELALRWNVSNETIMKAIRKGDIPAFQVAKKSLHRISMEWIENHESQADRSEQSDDEATELPKMQPSPDDSMGPRN